MRGERVFMFRALKSNVFIGKPFLNISNGDLLLRLKIPVTMPCVFLLDDMVCPHQFTQSSFFALNVRL